MTTAPDRDGFLVDLKALCTKHGAVIVGCGCCGSPSVSFSDGDWWAYDLSASPKEATIGELRKRGDDDDDA